MSVDKDILGFVNSSPVPAGMVQVFIGERPESPDDADMSKMVREIPARLITAGCQPDDSFILAALFNGIAVMDTKTEAIFKDFFEAPKEADHEP